MFDPDKTESPDTTRHKLEFFSTFNFSEIYLSHFQIGSEVNDHDIGLDDSPAIIIGLCIGNQVGPSVSGHLQIRTDLDASGPILERSPWDVRAPSA